MSFLKNNRFKLILMSLSILLFSSVIGSVVNAEYFSGGRKNNASPLAYYASSVSSYGYTSHYDAGRAYWNSHSQVNIAKTTSTTGRPDIYYIGNSSVSGLLGQIVPYTSTGSQASVSSYWDYTTVFMYDNQMRASSKYSASTVKYNAAHEIGHTIKMAHVPIPHNSVMVQGFYNIPSYLTSFDSGEVTAKW